MNFQIKLDNLSSAKEMRDFLDICNVRISFFGTPQIIANGYAGFSSVNKVIQVAANLLFNRPPEEPNQPCTYQPKNQEENRSVLIPWDELDLRRGELNARPVIINNSTRCQSPVLSEKEQDKYEVIDRIRRLRNLSEERVTSCNLITRIIWTVLSLIPSYKPWAAWDNDYRFVGIDPKYTNIS